MMYNQKLTLSLSLMKWKNNNEKVNIQQEYISKQNDLCDRKSGIKSESLMSNNTATAKHGLIVNQ